METIPAILAHNERELEAKLTALPRAAEAVHIDFINPPPRLPIGGQATHSFIKEGAKVVDFLEAHLMISHPQEYIAELVKVGFSRVLIQVEYFTSPAFGTPFSASSADRQGGIKNSPLEGSTPPTTVGGGRDVFPDVFSELIHEWEHSVEIAPSLKIDTPLEAIDSFAHEIQSVQLMGIAEIGAQGQPFDARVIPRVETLHARYPHLTISVDGGVNKENAEQLAAAGAARLVVGSALSEFYG